MPTVLIVDDDTDIVHMLVQVLQDEGYTVATGTGQEALALAQSAAPRVVLLDIMMPGMDGVEFARRLRDNPFTATVPIIAMSASHRLRERAAQMQVDDLLAKPFDLDDLLVAIQRVVNRSVAPAPAEKPPSPVEVLAAMRLMLASQVAASPWMNPARWRDAVPTGMLPDERDRNWHQDRYESIVARGADAANAAERARQAVMAFRIFPPERMIVALPDMLVSQGATIVQGIRVGPLGLIAAVRVLTVFDRDAASVRRAGFSYVTLTGHPERGAITFAVVEDRRDASARFEIDAVSRPGHWLTRLGAPVARAVQRQSTRAALRHVVALANALVDSPV